MTLRFENPKVDLMYGKKVCHRNHSDPNGRSVRRTSGACWACNCHLPEGPFTHNFGELPEQEYGYKVKYATEEEKRAAHVARQIKWNKENKEKYREAQERYHAKPEVIERRRERYANLTEEQREAIRIRQRSYYEKNKAARNAAAKEAYAEKKDIILARQRAAYHAKKEQDEHSGS